MGKLKGRDLRIILQYILNKLSSGIYSPDPVPTSVTGVVECVNDMLAHFISWGSVNSLSKITLHGYFYVINCYRLKAKVFLNAEEKLEIGTAPEYFG